MGKYVVCAGQNLYDVALHLTGSIEGIVDLLICNPELSFEDCLKCGDELVFTDGFVIRSDVVAYLRQNKIVPAGGERKVFLKCPSGPLRLRFVLESDRLGTGFFISGQGVAEVDWGDNSELDKVVLTQAGKMVEHRFDNMVPEKRSVRVYGEMELECLDLSLSGTQLVCLPKPLCCERLSLCHGMADLGFMALLCGVLEVRLQGSKLSCLLPLTECLELMRLDLRDADVSRRAVDEYLTGLVKGYYGRRSCEVWLPVTPSGLYVEPERDSNGNYMVSSGMEAVWLLTHEESWNEGGRWLIHTEEDLYEYQP